MNSKPGQIILMGVDPGSLITGYGIIQIKKNKYKILKCDAIVNKNSTSLPDRLGIIFNTLDVLIKKYKPIEIAIETAFYGKNAQSALKLGHARGAVMLAGYVNSVPMKEYSPREVKKAVTGTGAATKFQVMRMVKSVLAMKEPPKHFDTTDALAVALCHSYRYGNLKKIDKKNFIKYKNWKDFVTKTGNI